FYQFFIFQQSYFNTLRGRVYDKFLIQAYRAFSIFFFKPSSSLTTTYSSSYGDSFSNVSYAYASQFYDAYAFYHKAYSIQLLVNKIDYHFFYRKDWIRWSISFNISA